jgi:hypothetical protein
MLFLINLIEVSGTFLIREQLTGLSIVYIMHGFLRTWHASFVVYDTIQSKGIAVLWLVFAFMATNRHPSWMVIKMDVFRRSILPDFS